MSDSLQKPNPVDAGYATLARRDHRRQLNHVRMNLHLRRI